MKQTIAKHVSEKPQQGEGPAADVRFESQKWKQTDHHLYTLCAMMGIHQDHPTNSQSRKGNTTNAYQ